MSADRRRTRLRAVRAADRSAPPLLSVVVPVHQGREHLRRVLAAICDSHLERERWELIVVDDASTDGSAEVAAGHADLVVRLTGEPRGPAYARNRGFDVARGSFVAFVDADVLVQPHSLERMLRAIEQDSAIGAVVGTYDARRTSSRLVSEYRNLLRHVEHQRNGGDTDAFSAGLAIVRREAFTRAGTFDEWRFPRPQAEALELGDRLRSLGYRVLRLLDAEATHLRRWTLRDWIRVDLLDRGMSIARLNQLPEFRARADRLYLATPADAVLAWLAVTSLSLATLRQDGSIALLGSVFVLALVLNNANLFAAFAGARGVAFAAAAVPLHLVTCAMYGVASAGGRVLFHAVGEPQPDPVTQAFSEVGFRTWPPVPAPPSPSRSPANGAHPHPNRASAARAADERS